MSEGRYETIVLDRAQWLEYRRSHVGGSDAAAVMGIPGAFRTAYQVWAEKAGMVGPQDLSGNERVEWGVRLEGQVLLKFGETHGDLLVSSPGDRDHIFVMTSEDRPWAMATLDGIATDPDGRPSVVEVKTAHYPASREWGPDGSGASGVPPKYLAQVNHYLSVTGWDRAFVAVLIDGCDYREYEIGRDGEDVAAVTEAVDRFWHDNVEAGVAPTAAGADAQALLSVHPADAGGLVQGDSDQLALVEDWREAKARERLAKGEAANLASRLKAEIGDSSGLEFPEGRLVWKRTPSRRLDRKALMEAEPDLCERYSVDTVTQRLEWKGAE